MATTTNYGWTTPDDTSLVKDGASAIRTLGSAIDTSLNTALGTKKAGLVLLNTTSFSAVSSQASPVVFSATYDAYRILIKLSASSANTELKLRLRNNTTDETGANYIWSSVGQNVGGSVTTSNGGSGLDTSFGLSSVSSDLSFSSTALDIFDPFLSLNTAISGSCTGRASSNNYMRAHQGVLNTTTSYNSVNIYPSTGTMTGYISIYGYNK